MTQLNKNGPTHRRIDIIYNCLTASQIEINIGHMAYVICKSDLKKKKLNRMKTETITLDIFLVYYVLRRRHTACILHE